ncbi:uncharacterized protein LOC142326243 [Lycorma delicatula]|uniref:uncharacterized protein LOC142326243 n=1 Tax=Lycorma delicatula TaxID=130591 RepID=UPI003F51A07D
MRLLYFLLVVCTTALLLNETNAYNGEEYSTCIRQLRNDIRHQNQIRRSKMQECKTLQENGRTDEPVYGREQNPEERPVQPSQIDENRRRLEQPAQHSWDRSTEAPRRSYFDEERQRQELEFRRREEQRRKQEEDARRWEDQKRRLQEIQRQEEATRRWEEQKRRQEEEERELRNRHRGEEATTFTPFSAGEYVPNVKVPKFPPGFPFPPKCDRIPDVPGLEFPEGISSGYTASRVTTTTTHETFLCSDPRYHEEFYMAKTTLTTDSEDGVLQNSNNSNANYYYQNRQPFDWSPDVRVESPY